MRRLFALGFGSVTLLSGAFARADQPWATGKVVPTVQLSGSTSGKGVISAGVDFRTSHGDSWDIFLNPTFTVANTDGVASILTATSADGAAGPTQFSASFSASFASTNTKPLGVDPAEAAELVKATGLCLTHLGWPYASKEEETFAARWLEGGAMALLADPGLANHAAHQALAAAVDAKIVQRYPTCKFAERDASGPPHCRCTDANKSCDGDFDRLATEALTEAAKTCWGAATASPVCAFLNSSVRATSTAQYADLCDSGKSYYDSSKVLKEKTHELRKLLYPEHLLAVGVTYGAGVFKYLEGTGATLKESSSTRSSVAVNALFTYVGPRASARFTLELPIGFKSSWTESTTTAYQCSPVVGTLKGKSVETCEQTPMGEPTQGLQLSGAALFGVAAVADSDLWRAAIGPVFMVDLASKAKTTFQIGGEIPLYFSLVKAAGYEGDYEGMVRIMPTVLAERIKDDKGVATVGVSAGLSIALLGKRKMFGSQLYWP
jgi:hypothetical protein